MWYCKIYHFKREFALLQKHFWICDDTRKNCEFCTADSILWLYSNFFEIWECIIKIQTKIFKSLNTHLLYTTYIWKTLLGENRKRGKEKSLTSFVQDGVPVLRHASMFTGSRWSVWFNLSQQSGDDEGWRRTWFSDQFPATII